MKSTKIALYILINISCLLSLQGQSKLINKDILSKKEIEYLYNRLVDELLHNPYIGVIELSDYYNAYNHKDIIVEINLVIHNSILKYQKNKIDTLNFKKLEMKKKIKKVKLINSLKLKKVKLKNFSDVDSYFSKGLINFTFTDLFYSSDASILIGFSKLELIPRATSNEVYTGLTEVLKAKKCPNGHLIVQEIEVQSGLKYSLNTDKCDK